MDCASVNILALILYHCCIRCYHWRRQGKNAWALVYLAFNLLCIYSDFKINKTS